MTAPFLPAAIATFRKQKSLAERAIAQLIGRATAHRPRCQHQQHRRYREAHWRQFPLAVDRLSDHRRRKALARIVMVNSSTRSNHATKCSQLGKPVGQRSLPRSTRLREADLVREITIRGEVHSVPLAILRALDHCGYHVGQIVLTARLLVGDRPWNTLTIPRGQSQKFNEQYRKRESSS